MRPVTLRHARMEQNISRVLFYCCYIVKKELKRTQLKNETLWFQLKGWNIKENRMERKIIPFQFIHAPNTIQVSN